MVHAAERETVGAFLHHALEGIAGTGNDGVLQGAAGGLDLHRLRWVIQARQEVVLEELTATVGGAIVDPTQTIFEGEVRPYLPTVLNVSFDRDFAEAAVED